MTHNTSTPLWLNLKVNYIDENFENVINYIYQNNTIRKDEFYGITINLLERRIDALIEEFHDQPLLYDDYLTQDKERAKFTAQLLGLYLLSVSNNSKHYRTAFLLFAYTVAILEPRNLSTNYVSNALNFILGTLPAKPILEWKDIMEIYPEVIAHKLNNAMESKSGFTQNDTLEMMGTMQLSSKKIQLAATNKQCINQSVSTSLSILDDIINIITPKSDKLKQSKASDIENIREFASLFIADQKKVCRKLKKYAVGQELTVKLISKRNDILKVASTDNEYQQVQGNIVFPQKYFFYNECDFVEAINIDDEFDVVYLGEETFDIMLPYLKYIRDYLYEPNEIVVARVLKVYEKMIAWGTSTGLSVATVKIDNIEVGDYAEIKIKQLQLNEDGIPKGWISGDIIRIVNDSFDYNRVKVDTIAKGYIYEKEDNESTPTILTPELVKAIYRLLIFNQQHCVTNPTDRYKIICVSQMLATFIGKEDDVTYMTFLADYLENLVRFAKSEYDAVVCPAFPYNEMTDEIVRRKQIISILKAYGTTEDDDALNDIINNNEDPLLVKLATLVQSCNRLDGVINRSMQNVIKREIISSLAVEAEGDTDLDNENGTYLGIENDRLEFKTSFFHAPKNAKEQRQHINVFRSICAFLNTTDGGTLYMGVNDLGYVQGINSEISHLQSITYSNYKGIDGYMRYITDQAKIFFDIDVVANIKMRPMYNNQVIAIEIAPYEFGVVKLGDVAYLRVNAESVAISESAMQRVMARKSLSTIKKSPTIENLSLAMRSKSCAILHNYQSSNSGNISDRTVEVFDFTNNGTAIWCYDIDKSAVRLFNIDRIGHVELTQRPWKHQDQHKCGDIDIFNMTGSTSYNICLRLNLRAKNLLVEEFPRAKEHISNEGKNSWLLTTDVYNLAGVARFYIGLANSIEIVNAPELVEYVKSYCKTYLPH